MTTSKKVNAPRALSVAGLFAGIGGVEEGLRRAGHHAEILCEIDPHARAVLRKRFPGVDIAEDVRDLRTLPDGIDLVAAGFPCQDISLAGTQHGIRGARSGLVAHTFRLIRKKPPEFVLLENVLYLIKRDRGQQVRSVTDELEKLGYRWAYRVVDSRGFGLPQRRQRVVILASRGDVAPERMLFSQQIPPAIDDTIGTIKPRSHYGFYWTEGKRAVGWAHQAVPTIKGGSGLGIPSPPAIFDSATGLTGTPTIRDGERLQGFDPGWTDVSIDGTPTKVGKRWSLVGNAVSVPLAEWIGGELASPSDNSTEPEGPVDPRRPMPWAVSGSRSQHLRHDVSPHVHYATHEPIGRFLSEPVKPLSERAIQGFLSRVGVGVMNMPDEFTGALEQQLSCGNLSSPKGRVPLTLNCESA